MQQGAQRFKQCTAQGRQRYRHDIRQVDLCRELPVVARDLREYRLGVIHQIHLVYGQDDTANAEQRHQVAVPARLGQYTLARIDQDYRQVGGGRARDHVARVLLMPGRIGDNETPLRGREITIRHVDRDALLTLRAQPVGQQ